MAEVPSCPNSVKGNGCWKSDVRLVNETPDAWAFKCLTCRVLFVVSKDGVREKSKFDLAVQRRKQAEEEYERRMKKKRIFV
jgi:hypothetical protein